MKRKSLHFLLTLICLLGTIAAQSYSSLRMFDPRGWWWSAHTGEIRDVSLAVEPQGVYMKYDLYMTFDAANLPINPSDSLEVEFKFDLPKEAIVCDSWLWIKNYISYGIIMDVDSARKTYEDIVDRRVDPSILYKKSDTHYELRIFPISTYEPRKVKITFLLPAEWTKSQVLSILPINQLEYFVPAQTMDLLVAQDSLFPNPLIMEKPDQVFTPYSDTLHNNHLKTQLSLDRNFTIGFSSPADSGVYASYYPISANEGYYQLAMLPSERLPNLTPRKVLFLIDSKTTNGSDIRPNLGEIVKELLSPIDSFNLIVKSPNGVISAGPDWLSADPTTVDNHFDPDTHYLGPNGNLMSLLVKGCDFMKDHNNEGEIVLYSNNNDIKNWQDARDFYDDLTNQVEVEAPFYITSYKNDLSYWDQNLFFRLLAEESEGVYYFETEEMISPYFSNMRPLVAALGNFELMDLYSQTTNGFCYDRYDIDSYFNNQSVRTSILQTGRYYGDFPFTIDFFTIGNNGFQFFDISIPLADIHPAGESVRKGWAGHKLKELDEPYYVDAPTRKTIVDLSIDTRVLTRRTAFLCLEDTMPNGFPTASNGQPVSIPSLEEEAEVSLKAFPNPFEREVNIEIANLPNGNTPQLQLFDLQGRMICEFEVEQSQIVDGNFELRWNGSHLAKGVYMLMLKSGENNQMMRIVRK